MAFIEHSVCIRVPIESVYDLISHPEKNKEWIPDVIESEKLTEGPSIPGSRFLFVSRAPLGLTVRAEAEIVTVEPPRLLEFRSTHGFEHHGRWELEAQGESTCVRFRIEYRLSGIEAAVLHATGLRRFLKRHVRGSIEGLKRVLEQEYCPTVDETPGQHSRE